MDQIIQIVGALLILTAFAAVQLQRMRPDSRLYLALFPPHREENSPNA